MPVLPVEIMLLPRWFPFHLNKISYWARTTIVPLMVLATLKPLAKNPKGIGLDELFLQDPRGVGMTRKAPHQSWNWFLLFRALDLILRAVEPLFPAKPRARAVEIALAFIEERLNGEDGLGAIYPPMANFVMMYEALGHPENFPPRAITRRGIEKLLVFNDDEAYCQPCVSPVWSTALTCHALIEAGDGELLKRAKQGLYWLKPLQVLDVKGDWAAKAPETCGRAAGPSSTTTRTTPIPTPPSSSWPWIATAAPATASNSIRRSTVLPSGLRACKARTVASPRSMPTISNTI